MPCASIGIAFAASMLSSCDGPPTSSKAGGTELGHTLEQCRRLFASGEPPRITDDRMTKRTTPLCRRSFAVLHSGVVRSPLWAAEVLTAPAVRLARAVPYVPGYRPETALSPSERAENSDYVRSGYDRGHLAPVGDMPSEASASEATSLANVVPQSPALNRRSWLDLENAVRRQTRGGTVYVVSGPAYLGSRLLTTRASGRVPIPTHLWKAIYLEGRGATVLVATNDDAPRWTAMSINQFTRIHGIDPFPGVAARYRRANWALGDAVPGDAPSSGRAR